MSEHSVWPRTYEEYTVEKREEHFPHVLTLMGGTVSPLLPSDVLCRPSALLDIGTKRKWTSPQQRNIQDAPSSARVKSPLRVW